MKIEICPDTRELMTNAIIGAIILSMIWAIFTYCYTTTQAHIKMGHVQHITATGTETYWSTP